MNALFAGLDRLITGLLGLSLLALVGIGGAQIVLRVALSYPLPWATEFSVVLMIWATMLAGYVGVRRNSHLSADFLGLSMSAGVRRGLRLFSLALSLAFVLTSGWQSRLVIDAMEGIPFTSLPLTQPLLYWSLPAGAALMALALADQLWRERRAAPEA